MEPRYNEREKKNTGKRADKKIYTKSEIEIKYDGIQ